MPSCCVVGCTNRSTTHSHLKFYNIPAGSHPFKQNRRKLWLRAINRAQWPDALIKNARVCSAHFISGASSEDVNSPDFVPSLFSYKKTTSSSNNNKLKRYERKRKREARNEETIISTETEGEKENEDVDEVPIHNVEQNQESTTDCTASTVTKIVYDELKLQYDRLHCDYVNIRQEMYVLREENATLKERLAEVRFGFSSIKSNAKTLRFFTGLPTLALFHWLFKVYCRSSDLIVKALSHEDHLLVLLMKLRLGLSNRDIAYRFQVPVCSVSRIIRQCFPVLATVLQPLIKWPTKEAVMKNMPSSFKKKFQNCRCIIDCSEIFIDRPTNLTSRAQTWSNYKHHNTIKYLVGITPAGAISFLSPGWGGRVSDKAITVKSGFLDKLEYGDEILAARGFLIRDELAMHGATLKIPSFTKGKMQMSATEVDTSRQLSRVRIHVERVIGRWKNFKILQSIVPISQADLLDDMVTVCAGLTNLCPSVVKKKTRT